MVERLSVVGYILSFILGLYYTWLGVMLLRIDYKYINSGAYRDDLAKVGFAKSIPWQQYLFKAIVAWLLVWVFCP